MLRMRHHPINQPNPSQNPANQLLTCWCCFSGPLPSDVLPSMVQRRSRRQHRSSRRKMPNGVGMDSNSNIPQNKGEVMDNGNSNCASNKGEAMDSHSIKSPNNKGEVRDNSSRNKTTETMMEMVLQLEALMEMVMVMMTVMEMVKG